MMWEKLVGAGGDQDGNHQASPDNPLARYTGKWYWLCVASLVLLVGFVTAWSVYISYDNLIDTEYENLEVQAMQREARISGALRSVNLMLGAVIDDLLERPNATPDEKKKLLKTYLKQLPETSSLLIADSNGIVIAHTVEKAIGYNAVDRQYFKHHRELPGDGNYFISPPFKTVTGTIVTTLSRTIPDNNGRFNGVVAAALGSIFFTEALSTKTLEPGLISALINRDGDVINNYPDQSYNGKSIKGGIAFTEHIESGQATTRHLNRTKLDGEKTLSVFHNVPNSPLVVIVSHDYDILISDWLPTAYSHVAGFIVLATATVFFSVIARIRLKSLTLAQQQILANELKLMTLIQSEPECVKQVAADGTLLFMNRAGLEMIEADNLEQVLGKKVAQMILPDYRADFIELNDKVFLGESGTLEFEIQGIKGGRRFLESHVVPLRNPQGMIVSALSVTRNITDRKKAETEREAALRQIKTLEGIIPICMHCKKIRDDKNSWNQLEEYITNHSTAVFSHGICPQCLRKHYPELK